MLFFKLFSLLLNLKSSTSNHHLRMAGVAKVLALIVLSLISSTIAETGIPPSAFENNPADAASQAAP